MSTQNAGNAIADAPISHILISHQCLSSALSWQRISKQQEISSSEQLVWPCFERATSTFLSKRFCARSRHSLSYWISAPIMEKQRHSDNIPSSPWKPSAWSRLKTPLLQILNYTAESRTSLRALHWSAKGVGSIASEFLQEQSSLFGLKIVVSFHPNLPTFS